jgi:Ca-activated chloride channel family protein
MGFAEILRRSPYADGWTLATVQKIARAATPAGNAEREELLELLGRAARSPKVAAR